MIQKTAPVFVANKSLCYSSSVNSCLFLLWLKGPKPYTRIAHTMKTQSLLTTNAASRGPGMESSQDCMRTMPTSFQLPNPRLLTLNIIDYCNSIFWQQAHVEFAPVDSTTYPTQQLGIYLAAQSQCREKQMHSCNQDFNWNKNQNNLSSNWNTQCVEQCIISENWTRKVLQTGTPYSKQTILLWLDQPYSQPLG